MVLENWWSSQLHGNVGKAVFYVQFAETSNETDETTWVGK